MTLYGYTEYPFEFRNYAMFNLLAGVRGPRPHIVPISQPRGLPADATSTARDLEASWSRDGHSASWIAIDELKRGYSWREIEELGPEFFASIRRCDMKDVDRIVFLFDN